MAGIFREVGMNGNVMGDYSECLPLMVIGVYSRNVELLFVSGRMANRR
jgi:hypothetical protein